MCREHSCIIFSLQQGRTETCDTFLWAEGVQGAENHTHIYVLSMGPMLRLRKSCMSG
jgi:hypothetical protein